MDISALYGRKEVKNCEFVEPVEVEWEHVAEDVVLVGPVPRLPPEEVAAPLSSHVNLPSSAGTHSKKLQVRQRT